jgi:diketogulonate reductase-like aldo/keto reductase
MHNLIAQVTLNYIRAKGLVPLPGVTSRKQAQEVAGCIGWRLNGEEVSWLNFRQSFVCSLSCCFQKARW